jgi:uncharacterized protein with PIN domain
MDRERKIRFAAEMTLGKLAKWLRMLGFDTVYWGKTAGEEWIDSFENRILLTRTKRIRDMKSVIERIFITSDHPFEQVREVVFALDIVKEDIHLFSRCIQCNAPTRSIEKNEIRGKVPDYIWATQETFRTCPHCRRIYWSGSHTQRSRDIIEKIFK